MKRGKTNEKKLKKTYEKVRTLSLATPKARKTLVRKDNREIVDCISECCTNLLKGNVPLTSKQTSDLCRHKEKLRLVARKKTSLKKKTEVIQKGGFVGSLLIPVAAYFGNLLLGGKKN